MIVIGFLLENLCLGLGQLVLIGILLNQEEQPAFFYHVAILKKDFFQKALDPGPELHRINRLRVAGKFQVVRYFLAHRLDYRNLGRRRRGIDIPVTAGRNGQNPGPKSHDKDIFQQA